MLKLLLLFPFLALMAFYSRHPLKMCVCEVVHKAGQNKLSFKFKFFWDDLETVLEKQEKKNLNLLQQSEENKELLSRLVRANFTLKINDKPITLRFDYMEVKDVILAVYFSADNFQPSPQYRIALENKILLDAFSDQYNLVRFDFFNDGNLETLRFERKERFLEKIIIKR